MEVINPSTASPIAAIALASHPDVDAAVAAAREALPTWSLETTAIARRRYVEKLLEIYLERQDEMGQIISMEMGAPIDMARASQAGSGAYHIETFLAAMDHFAFERTVPGDDEDDPSTLILMDPVGVVAMIT
jgi:aldehyde dehydrogenase (NAD+)